MDLTPEQLEEVVEIRVKKYTEEFGPGYCGPYMATLGGEIVYGRDFWISLSKYLQDINVN